MHRGPAAGAWHKRLYIEARGGKHFYIAMILSGRYTFFVQKQFAFPRSRRLRLDAEFKRVRAEGKSIRGELLTLAVLKNTDQSAARAGFITSKRVGNAVIRNRTRRRLREIFRRHQHDISPGTWLVNIATARAARASFATLEDEWLRLARRASILAP